MTISDDDIIMGGGGGFLGGFKAMVFLSKTIFLEGGIKLTGVVVHKVGESSSLKI